jgi:cytochrome c peroxidase
MMLPSDMALLEDKKFLHHVENYADKNELFVNDFSKAYTKLTELGCKNLTKQKWTNQKETFEHEEDKGLKNDAYLHLQY